MSDLVGNPEDRFSHDMAYLCHDMFLGGRDSSSRGGGGGRGGGGFGDRG